jgi:hypothetical protein
MARCHGKDLSSLTLNSQALLSDTVALGFKASAETHDTTTIGDDWKEATAGLKGGDEISHELFYDNANTTGSYYFVTNLLGGAAVTLSFGDGTRTTACSVIVKSVDLPVSVADMMKFTATYQITGAVTFS